MAQGRGNAIVFALAVLALLQVAAAKDYTVGDTNGWTFAPPTNLGYYDSWASKINFSPGDNLVFNYGSGQHDVQIVSASEYAGCVVSTGKTYTSGMDTIPLPKAGDYYFICNFISHCDQGMKMKVTVTGAATPPATTPPAKAPVIPPVVAPATPPTTPPTPAPVVKSPAPAPVVKAPAPAPVVKAPAPAPVVKAPTPAPVKAPTPAPVKAPVPSPVPVAAPVPVVAPTPAVTVPVTPAAAPVPPTSSGQAVRVCLSFAGASVMVVFGVLLF